MKFCQPHWDELKAALDARGLSRFVADSGQKLVARIESELSEGETQTNFEPLLSAHFAIIQNALDKAGLEAIVNNADGSERCPLCYLIDHCPCLEGLGCAYRTWIGHAADDELERAKTLGLVGQG